MKKNMSQIFFKTGIVIFVLVFFMPTLLISTNYFTTYIEKAQYFVFSSIFITYISVFLSNMTFKYYIYKIDNIVDYNSKKNKNIYEYVIFALGTFIYVSSLVLVVYYKINTSIYIYLWYIFVFILIILSIANKDSFFIGNNYIIYSMIKINISEIRSIQSIYKEPKSVTIKIIINTGEEVEIRIKESNVKKILNTIKNNTNYVGS